MTAGVVGHLIVGPGEHGVVRHARAIADAGPSLDAVVVVDQVGELSGSELERLGACSTVHVAFTDRLFGASCEAAAGAFAALAQRLAQGGAAVVVGLHDLPDPAFGALQRRRAAAYRMVAEAASAVIVGSHHEAALTRDLGAATGPIVVIPLPVAGRPTVAGARSPDPAPRPRLARPGEAPAAHERTEAPAPAAGAGSSVVRAVVGQPTVLGFIYPGKGHDDVLAALGGLAADLGVVALGRPSDGHQGLADELLAMAAAQGRRFEVTGFVADDDLPAALAAAGVPIAPHARVSASASIAAWLGAGRRPLVPDVPYVRELEQRTPGSMQIYRGIHELRVQLRLALDDPARTWLDRRIGLGPTLAEVARLHREVLQPGAPVALRSQRSAVVEPALGAVG